MYIHSVLFSPQVFKTDFFAASQKKIYKMNLMQPVRANM